MPESTQHKLDRIRPPRVQITYDVETRGSFVKTELPFVAGILADLSGNVEDPKRLPLRDRKYVEIDRDNFNDIMAFIGPKAEIKGGKTLEFKNIDDFSPINVLKQLTDLNDRFEKRKRLSDVVAKLDGNVKLQQKFLELLKDETKLKDMKQQVDGLKAELAPKTEPAKPAGPNAPVETPKETEGGSN